MPAEELPGHITFGVTRRCDLPQMELCYSNLMPSGPIQKSIATLPLFVSTPSDDDPAPKDATSPVEQTATSDTPTILVVDDDMPNLMLAPESCPIPAGL